MVECELCERLRNQSGNNGRLARLDACDVFSSPFADRWPGSLMAVFHEHVRLFSEVRSPHLVHANLLMVERAIVRTVRPLRMNVVKFANACDHLHWHLIPRFQDESFPEKNPWELSGMARDQIHQKHADNVRLLARRDSLENAIRAELEREKRGPLPGYFSCAFFLRPIERSCWSSFRNLSLADVAARVRTRPGDWETLLMRRNYADFSWDHIGGRADCGEFPLQTLRREVSEEIGWELSETLEVARQWQAGIPRGFIFLATPRDALHLVDRIPSNSAEVSEFGFHCLENLRHSSFPERVRGRVEALISGLSDYVVVK